MTKLLEAVVILVPPIINFFFYFLFKKIAVNNEKLTVDFFIFNDISEKEAFVKQLIEK